MKYYLFNLMRITSKFDIKKYLVNNHMTKTLVRSHSEVKRNALIELN